MEDWQEKYLGYLKSSESREQRNFAKISSFEDSFDSTASDKACGFR
jgi:hypothetical protein